jgi:hypothetical protein
MRRIAVALMFVAACSGGKTAPTDDFSNLDGVDQKSDAFSTHMKIVGSLDYNTTSSTVKYTSSPKYRAFKFAGNKGDQVDVWVRSPDFTGDAVAWVLDNNFKTLSSNDDADDTTLDAHISLTLPGNKNASIVTYYVVFRDYWMSRSNFQVSLSGPADYTSCKVDSDCVKISKTCCSNLGWIAVNGAEADAYTASLSCAAHPICPLIATRPDYSAAECNAGKCELVQPADISCGGFILNAHSCPDGYVCGGNINPDLPGKCYQQCGGFAGIACHDAGQVCADNPWDSCDPTAGGADCPGICKACVQTVLCMTGSHFDTSVCKCVADSP